MARNHLDDEVDSDQEVVQKDLSLSLSLSLSAGARMKASTDKRLKGTNQQHRETQQEKTSYLCVRQHQAHTQKKQSCKGKQINQNEKISKNKRTTLT